MLFIILSLYFKITPSSQIQIDKKSNDNIYSNVTFEEKEYSNNFIVSQTEEQTISFSECSFSSIVPTSYFSDSSIIYTTNSDFIIYKTNFTSCSFTSALLYVEESNLTMNFNEIKDCYNFNQGVSVSNIIRCLRTISIINFNAITFDSISHSCRGLYFAECNDTTIKNLTVTNSNILRNHGNAVMFSTTSNLPKVKCIIENSNFVDCGESDFVLYSTLNVITINQTNITFSKQNDQEIGGLYFPSIATYTLIKVNFINIPGSAVTFSDEERTIKPYSIRLNRCNFESCKKCVLCKLRGDQLTFANFTFQEIEFDSTLLEFEGNTKIINFKSVSFQSCPKTKTNENFIFDIPMNNIEFNFDSCTISSSHFSCSQSCIYFGRTGKYTFRKTNLIGLSVAGIIFSDEENNDEKNEPLEVQLLDDTSFPMCGCCVMFNIQKSSISNCLCDNLIFQSDLITFNKTLKSIVIENCNFSKCFSSYQGTSIIELPSNNELEFTMRNCIFNYTHLLSGTAIEILNKIKSVLFVSNQFIDIEGDLFIDIDKYGFENPGPIKIINCSFKNSQSSYDGAAIRISSLCESRQFEIYDCYFNNCYSKKSFGGAISFNAFNGKIQKCTFVDNRALNGADIYYNAGSSNENNKGLSIDGNIFIRDKDYDNDLSLFYFNIVNETNYHFHHNKFFINETLDHIFLFGANEKAKNVNYSRISIEYNCMVETNKDKIKSSRLDFDITYETAFQWTCNEIMNMSLSSCPQMPEESDEIYNGIDVEEVENKQFYSCSQIYDSQLIIQNSILGIYYCSFISMKPKTNMGGAIYISINKTLNSKLIEIHNCSFESCENKIGGAVFIHSSIASQKFDIQDCNFTSNKANDNVNGNGAAIYFNSLQINLVNCKFNDNKATKNGGAIYYENVDVLTNNNDDINALFVSDCIFVSNSVDNQGGAIFISIKEEIQEGSIFINSCEFNKCESIKNGGGGIFFVIEKPVYDQINIQYNSFKNCKATFAGGIYVFSNIETNKICIKSCEFISNEATQLIKNDYEDQIGGSSIFLEIKNGTVDNCKFEKPKGKIGPIKVVNIYDKIKMLSEKNDNLIVIQNSIFDVNINSLNSVLNNYKDDKNGIEIIVQNCSFIYVNEKNSHYFDEISITKNVIDSSKLKIGSCKFTSKKEKYVSFTMKSEKFNSKIIIGILIPSSFLIIVVAIIALNLFKTKIFLMFIS